MNTVGQILRRLLSLIRKGRLEREMEEEMRFHLEMQIEQNLSSGMADEEARYAAVRQFGNQTWLKEASREMWSLSSIETLIQDLRYGARMLLRNPGFTLIALITLALGIGVNTAIFSVVNTVLLRPLPYPAADQLVMIWGRLPQHGLNKLGASAPEFADYRAQNRVFSSIAAYTSANFTLTGAGDPERISGAITTADLFPLLGVQPLVGRAFSTEEDRPGQGQVVMLSHDLWRRRFASNPDVIGQSVTLNGQPHTIVGVMPAGFQFPSADMEIWKPIAFTARELSENERGSHYLSVIARLQMGLTRQQAQAEVAAIAQQMQQRHPTIYEANSGWGATVVSRHEEEVGEVSLVLWVLFGAVGLVALIACVNVANLLLARAATREREMAVRAALGAGRWRIVRQLLTESLLLALVGGSLGVALAAWANRLLIALAPADFPRLDEVGLDARVLGFTAALSLLTGILFGLAPAWQVWRLNPGESLKAGGKVTEGRARQRMRGLLVAGEIALALMLLVGAGLLIKSLYRLRQIEPGFDPANVLTMRLALPQTRYPEPQQQRAFFEQLIARLAALPGVTAAGAVNYLPLSGTGNRRNFSIEGQPEPKLNLEFRQASPGYFRALGFQLRAGRFFDERDRENATRVALINETFAHIFFAGENPLGKRLKLGGADSPFPWLSVAGVIGDVKSDGLDMETQPEMYVPYLQPLLPNWSVPPMFLAVRAESNPAGLIAAVRGVARESDREQPVYGIATMERLLARSIAPRRFNMLLLAAFAALALLLAAVGIYGVMAYAVNQRTREIGIRLALGAQTRDVQWLIIKQGMALVALGAGLGLAGALALTRLLEKLLFSVEPTDPLTFVLVPLALSAVALAACYLPARRATKVDPLTALRVE